MYAAAGYNYIDRQCNNYFDKLTLLQHKTGFTNDLIGAGGATAGAIMGLAKASSMAIGIVAAGFGFAGAAITAFDKRALLTPYPEETKTLIIGALHDYRDHFQPKDMHSAAEAITNVQRYAEFCTYSGITRAAKQAISGAKASVGDVPSAEDVVLGAAIAATLGLSKPLDDSQNIALYWLVNHGGPACTPAASCAQALSSLPKPVQDKFYDPVKKVYLPVDDIKKAIGGELDRSYASDAKFKSYADAFPAQPPVPAVPAPAAPPVAAVKPVPAPVVKAPAKLPPLADTFRFMLQQPNVSSRIKERFGLFSVQSPAPPPKEEEKPN